LAPLKGRRTGCAYFGLRAVRRWALRLRGIGATCGRCRIEAGVAIRPPSSGRPRGTPVIRSRNTRTTGSGGRRPSIREPHRLHPVCSWRSIGDPERQVMAGWSPPRTASGTWEPAAGASVARDHGAPSVRKPWPPRASASHSH